MRDQGGEQSGKTRIIESGIVTEIQRRQGNRITGADLSDNMQFKAEKICTYVDDGLGSAIRPMPDPWRLCGGRIELFEIKRKRAADSRLAMHVEPTVIGFKDPVNDGQA